MPYVAPMPNPDMVTGPDWTTLLGSVALGLTKGVGEGAEILQRDKAQKMQQQRDAAEQAYRDRQLEAEKTRWDADAAYRNEHFKFEQGQAQNQAGLAQKRFAFDVGQAQNQMELSAYNAGLHGQKTQADIAAQQATARWHDQNAASLEEQRKAQAAALQETTRIKKLTERGATLHGQGGDRDTFIQRKTDEIMNAYGISPDDMTASDEARQFINAKIQPELEAFDYYTGTVKGVPDKDGAGKNEWTMHVDKEGHPIRLNTFTGAVERVDLPPTADQRAAEEQTLQDEWNKGEAEQQSVNKAYQKRGWPGREAAQADYDTRVRGKGGAAVPTGADLTKNRARLTNEEMRAVAQQFPVDAERVYLALSGGLSAKAAYAALLVSNPQAAMAVQQTIAQSQAK
jgi:hypothetical protein